MDVKFENKLYDLKLTKNEIKTLTIYLKRDLIDAKGYCAIGVGNPENVQNIKSILQKINKAEINRSDKSSLEDKMAVARDVSKAKTTNNAEKQIENER